jgi:CheY-like chemotaxis protein
MSKKILLIDDDVDIVEMNRVLLEQAGYQVCIAYNGADGLQKVLEEKPDLVVLDVMMTTAGEGFEVAKQIRRQEQCKDLPILMLTGVNMESGFSLRVGPDKEWNPVDGFIDKPVKKEVLLNKIAVLLQSQPKKS